jgi:hypothetical protein
MGLPETVEIIPSESHTEKLYWVCDQAPPKNKPRSYYFCIDDVKTS